MPQELHNERERSAALQRQLDEQARSMQEALSRASTLSDDNQKLKDAVERLSKSATDKTDETVRYMQEAGELRKANITLEAAAQQARDEKASAERQLQSQEKVRARWACKGQRVVGTASIGAHGSMQQAMSKHMARACANIAAGRTARRVCQVWLGAGYILNLLYAKDLNIQRLAGFVAGSM